MGAPQPNPPRSAVAPHHLAQAFLARHTHRRRPKGLVCAAVGRGRTGKTTTLRALLELALRAGRAAVAADGDRFNQSLAAFEGLGRAMRPGNASEEALREWLERAVGYAVEQRVAVALDLGGGDRSLIARAGELMERVAPALDGLADWGLDELAELAAGAEITVLYFLAGGQDDARGLALLNRSRLAEAPLLLVLNEALAPATRNGGPFDANLADPAVKAAIARGAAVVRLPALPPHIALFVEACRTTFAEAAAGMPAADGEPLGIWDRQTLAAWLRAVQVAFAPHAGLVP